MKLETIKTDKRKKIVIGSMIVLSMVGCITLTTTRAKYQSVQSLKLANGTINYCAPDLKLAIKVSEDGTTYKNSNTIPESNYTLNTEKSKCRIPTSALTGEDAPIAEGVTIEYIDGKINVLGVTKKDTRCYIYFDKVLGQTSSSIIADIKNRTDGSYKGSTTPTFTSVATGSETEDNNGIFETDDPMYGENAKTYYWRGATTTNHVIFDNKCWRIVRINGDGSTRLIYNGMSMNNTCTGNGSNSAAIITGSSNAEMYYATSDGKRDNSSYVGWTYSLGNQRTTGGTPSNAKTQTEKYYTNNISDSAKNKIDPNGKFCNDRNVGEVPSGWGSGFTMTWSAIGTKFAYAGAKRIYQDMQPILSCNSEDIYSLAIGAITVDEVIFTGGLNKTNAYYYSNTGESYWTMSPIDRNGTSANIFYVDGNGRITNANANYALGLRPVINLRSDVTFNVGSDGTQNNPYIVQ